jgi:hypothetical protein
MDSRWEVHGQICLRNATRRRNKIPRTQTDLENMGSSKGQDLPVACVPPETLDGRLKEKARTGRKGLLLPMRPHHSHMPVHQGALASHRPNTQAANTTTLAHSLALVATPTHTLERRTSGWLGQPLRPCLLAGLERMQRPLLQTSTIFHERAAPDYQGRS